ncbi:unnamed protein product [Acanthoscelides obtectus]|uniref:Uncharacterized protein n=1 Tax=Acanthoscelides obtectus TaxID=200917 RepID=A0A9P0JJ20_ACAOB|nr:unnamed protein product [Acanthoscelides obtectus]CAK1673014.1 hypothetical protein AOBTE_LOCUS29197 [Acanthoscelides obtectus]
MASGDLVALASALAVARCANRPKKMSRCSATYTTPSVHCCQYMQECR